MFFQPLYIMAVRSLTYIKNSFVRSYPEKRIRGKIGHEAKFELAALFKTFRVLASISDGYLRLTTYYTHTQVLKY
jgi:hypothetical protein